MLTTGFNNVKEYYIGIVLTYSHILSQSVDSLGTDINERNIIMEKLRN